MGRSIRYASCVVWVLLLAAGRGDAQAPLSSDEISRVQAAIGSAFGFLFALPRDTAGAAMESWVLDSDATTDPGEGRDEWRIVVTKLTDTGDALQVEEMTGKLGSSPRELAAAMAEMQQLEAKISQAEAEASLEVVVTLNDAETVIVESAAPAHQDHVVEGAWFSRHTPGHWMRVEDRQLEITIERWVPAQLYVRFGAAPSRPLRSVVITSRGNEQMIERLLRETRWHALAALVQ